MTVTFLLGLGGQKCGSTWYRDYLARQTGSDFGRLGEYQVWEHDLGGPFARYRVTEPSMPAKLRAEAKRRLGLRVPADYLRWRMQRNRDEYFDYFARLLARSGVVRTGDVTPSYAALPAPMLAGIRDGFAARGIAVKALFAMRDPVARLRSHLRMDRQKRGQSHGSDEAAALATFYAGPEAAARMRYDLTLDAVEAVFAPADRHLCLFEEMVTPHGIAALADFAGVPSESDAAAMPVNARGSQATPLPEALQAEIARHYAPVYKAAHARLPQVAALWPSARHLDF